MMGAGSETYARLALESGKQNQQILPRGVDIEAAMQDLEALDNLRPVLKALQQLTEMLDDTVAALGSDVMFVANLVYSLLQSVGKAEGLDETLKELRARHARPRRKKPTPESDPNPGE